LTFSDFLLLPDAIEAVEARPEALPDLRRCSELSPAGRVVFEDTVFGRGVSLDELAGKVVLRGCLKRKSE
jgi:hypothetical protein